MKIPVLQITLGVMAILLTTHEAYSNAAACIGLIAMVNFVSFVYDRGKNLKTKIY